jgi:hypothetical protein
MSQPGTYVVSHDYNTGRDHFDIEFNAGATGAVPTFPTGFSRASPDAVAGVTRLSAGIYVVTLKDQWADLLFASGWVIQTASQAVPGNYSAAGIAGVVVLQNLSATATKTITFGLINGAGAITEAANGDDIYFHIEPQWFTNGSQQ